MATFKKEDSKIFKILFQRKKHTNEVYFKQKVWHKKLSFITTKCFMQHSYLNINFS